MNKVEFQDIAHSTPVGLGVDDLAGDADPELGTLLGDQPSSSLPHAHLHSSGMGGSSMGSEGTAGSGNGGGWLSSLFSLEAYQVYFDVNTQLIGSRLSKALMPFGEELFYQETDKPDLYGPFWIATTLIFSLVTAHSFAEAFNFIPSDEKLTWQFDFSKFTLACSVCYSCVSLLPLTVHLMLQRMGFSAPQGLRPSLLKTVSVYGYSLFGFIPVCFLCLIKLAFIRWTAFITGFLLSTYFILRNILNIQDPKLSLNISGFRDEQTAQAVAGALILVQLTLALIFKYAFFF